MHWCNDVLMSIALTGAVPQITLAHRLRIAREFAGLYLRAIAEATGVWSIVACQVSPDSRRDDFERVA